MFVRAYNRLYSKSKSSGGILDGIAGGKAGGMALGSKVLAGRRLLNAVNCVKLRERRLVTTRFLLGVERQCFYTQNRSKPMKKLRYA